MGKLARWIGAVSLLLLLAVVGLWLLSRALGPSDRQEAALALLDRQEPAPGENAFAAFWLMSYDVPEEAKRALVVEDAERIASMPEIHDADGNLGFPKFRYAAEGRFANVAPPEPDWQKFCKSREPGCLDKVRTDPAGYARLLEKHASLVAHASDLRRYGHYRTLVPLRADMPLPAFQYALAPMTRNAADFAAGNVDAALSGVCENAAAWRRIGANSDMLIARMIGISYVANGYSRLFADMLAELPADHPLPAVCKVAFAAPTQEEGSLCRAMKGESRFIREGLARDVGPRKRNGTSVAGFYFPLIYSQEMTEARLAPEHAYACSDRVRESLSADLPVQPYVAEGIGFDCFGNAAGCALARIGSGDGYTEYIRRGQDYQARLRLAATLLWLRGSAGDGRTPEQRLRERPAALVAAGHRFELAEGGRWLRATPFEERDSDLWQLPMPASRMPPAKAEP